MNHCARYLIGMAGLLGFGVTATATPGDLDPEFGTGGRVTLRSLEVGSPDYSMIQQTDGKLVVTGGTYVGNDVRTFLVRLESNGSPDLQFAAEGVWVSAIVSSIGEAVIQQVDGKLVVGGTGWTEGHGYDAHLIRLMGDGTADQGFGTGGDATLDLGGSETITGILEQSGGQLVVAGTVESLSSGDTSLFFARLDGSGNLDPTFGNGGTLIVELPVSWNGATSFLQQQPDGLIWTGHANGGLAIVAITPGGALRSSFGQQGIVEIPAADIDARHNRTSDGSAALQADGRIVIVGTAYHFICCDPWGDPTVYSDGFALRLTPAGALDPTFGSGGIVHDSRDLASPAIQDDGRIVIAYDTFYEAGLLRLNADGSADEGFGSAGAVVADFRSAGEELAYISLDLIRQPDGKLVMASGAAVRETGFGWFPAISRFGDAGFAGLIGLESIRSYTVEATESMVLFVRRTGGSQGAVSASFEIVDDTATQGEDYVAQAGRLDWSDGDTSEKAIVIDLIDDAVEEPDESLVLNLTAAEGGAFLTASTGAIFIDDNDGATTPPPPPSSPPPTTGSGGGGASALEWLFLLALLNAVTRRRRLM